MAKLIRRYTLPPKLKELQEKDYKLNYGVAIDGSKYSESAFNIILKKILTNNDRITLISIIDRTKHYDIAQYNFNDLKKIYKNALISHVI